MLCPKEQRDAVNVFRSTIPNLIPSKVTNIPVVPTLSVEPTVVTPTVGSGASGPTPIGAKSPKSICHCLFPLSTRSPILF